MIDNIFNLSATVSRPTVSNTGGIFTKTFTEVGTVRCRIGTASKASERNLAGSAEWVAEARRLYCPADGDLQKDDRVAADGAVYRVVNVQKVYDRRKARFLQADIINWK